MADPGPVDFLFDLLEKIVLGAVLLGELYVLFHILQSFLFNLGQLMLVNELFSPKVVDLFADFVVLAGPVVDLPSDLANRAVDLYQKRNQLLRSANSLNSSSSPDKIT